MQDERGRKGRRRGGRRSGGKVKKRRIGVEERRIRRCKMRGEGKEGGVVERKGGENGRRRGGRWSSGKAPPSCL